MTKKNDFFIVKTNVLKGDIWDNRECGAARWPGLLGSSSIVLAELLDQEVPKGARHHRSRFPDVRTASEAACTNGIVLINVRVSAIRIKRVGHPHRTQTRDPVP